MLPGGGYGNHDSVIEFNDVGMSYDGKKALFDINMAIPKNKITAYIGPSGCGKSTLLRCMNRLNDLIDGTTLTGTIKVSGRDIYDAKYDVSDLRRRVGMVFQKSNPFPKSIYDNVAYGPRIGGLTKRAQLDEIVETSLKNAALWDEVKERLGDSALSLSGGQQQRLCIARAIAVEPEVILMDEPCSALDPISTDKIEELMIELKNKYTIAIVTHNMQQAARISDYTVFMLLGRIVEHDETVKIFENPTNPKTQAYIMGKFG